MGADRAGQAPHDEPAPEEPQSPVSQVRQPFHPIMIRCNESLFIIGFGSFHW